MLLDSRIKGPIFHRIGPGHDTLRLYRTLIIVQTARHWDRSEIMLKHLLRFIVPITAGNLRANQRPGMWPLWKRSPIPSHIANSQSHEKNLLFEKKILFEKNLLTVLDIKYRRFVYAMKNSQNTCWFPEIPPGIPGGTPEEPPGGTLSADYSYHPPRTVNL